MAPCAEVHELTLLGYDDALLVMHAYRWRHGKLMDDWLDDSNAVLRKIGLTTTPVPSVPCSQESTIYCAVEMEDFPRSQCDSLQCGHVFSIKAWRGHLAAALEDPVRAIMTRCLHHGCTELVRGSFFQKHVGEAEWARWQEYSLRRFANDSSTVSYCPSPDCPWAVLAPDPAGELVRHGAQCTSACLQVSWHTPFQHVVFPLLKTTPPPPFLHRYG